MLQITVKYFAIAREISGRQEEQFELAEGSTTEDIWPLVLQEYPELKVHRPHSRLALNMQYVQAAQALNNDDEVCVIPPVSGG